MKTTLIQIGKNKDKFLKDKIEYYKKQIPNFEIIELKDSDKDKNEKAIIEKLSEFSDVFSIALSEEGKELSSKEFSDKISKLEQEYKNLVFCIAGPDGFNKPITFANECLSLSKMTFTHDMAQLFLVEQIYRAKEIKKGSKYHRV